MTAEQLEELLATKGWVGIDWADLDAFLQYTKTLARRVIAAEKLVEAASKVRSLDEDDSEAIVRLSDYRDLRAALTAYREASK